MPVSPSSFEYQFSPDALKQVRDRLGLSQAKLAGLLDLPVNTVSRWERGETTPDAHSLAAIYSIAKEQGLEPEFFQRTASMVSAKKKAPQPLNGRKVLNRNRTRLVMSWDFQNVALNAEDAYSTWFYMDKFLDIAFPEVNKWELNVYASWQQNDAAKSMRFVQVRQVGYNADSQIAQETRRLCGVPEPSYFRFYGTSDHDPKSTIMILVSKDGDFANLVSEAREAGVDVYLWAPPGCSNELTGAVAKANIIPWNHPCKVISQDNLKRIGS